MDVLACAGGVRAATVRGYWWAAARSRGDLPAESRGTVLLLCGMAAHGTWSTSREVMQALMPGDEEVESGEGAGRGYLRQLTACRAHDVYDRLGEITAPTRVIHEGVGHIPEVECDERFNSDLLAFLP